MFGELFKDIKNTVGTIRHGAPTTTLHIAKPYCMPSRPIITKALQPYGVKVWGIHEQVHKISLRDCLRRMRVELRTFDNLKFGPAGVIWLPAAWHAEVVVNEAAAAWAEYLLLRTGKLYVPGAYQNPRNQQWAAQHGGKMPPAWKDGKAPWIETNCGDGMDAWRELKRQRIV
ncbi:MAG: hypothetical protein AB7L09_24750 [Nitrospira sp.]